MLPGFVYADFNDIESVKKKISKKTAAVMVEFVQGEGGIIPANKKFIKDLFKLAKENNFLIIADEIQTGLGRTGSLFAYESYNVKPDIITLAKPLGGGLPLGAMLKSKEVPNKYFVSYTACAFSVGHI